WKCTRTGCCPLLSSAGSKAAQRRASSQGVPTSTCASTPSRTLTRSVREWKANRPAVRCERVKRKGLALDRRGRDG
ncbi:hypothetical protein T484DRAFT_1898284, partial [Baffinella frigidus]